MVTNFSNNAACRGEALPRAKFMGYLSRHYPDSMANLCYNNDFYNDAFPERDVLRSDYQGYIKRSEAPLRAEFKEFRQTVQQEICQM